MSETRLSRLLLAAKTHGEESGEPEHEVGDLQDVLTTCWMLLDNNQRDGVVASHSELLSNIE